MDKEKVSEILEEMGVLMELKGENPFKVRAHHNGAEIIATLSTPLEELIEKNVLTKIKGIGPGLAEKITELVQTGKCQEYEKLKKSFPKHFLDILRIPGLGAKKAKVLHEKLKIKDLKSLEKACKDNKIARLNGFGERTQRKILEGIRFLSGSQDYHLYDMALDEAEKMLKLVRKNKEVIRSEIAGSLRRHKEVIGDVDILVSAKNSKKIMDSFVKAANVESVLARGETKSSVQLDSGIQVDLRVVSDREYPFALQYFTGSKEHGTALRTLAKKKGYKLNEYGIFKGERKITCIKEDDIYKLLGLQYIPPEMRENIDEIELARKNKIPKLLEEKDLKGTFHVHSTWSDGKDTLEAMIRAAQKAGFEYVGLSDHSKSAYYANGLKPDRVKKQHQEIDKLQKKFKNIRLFKGTECDILTDGSMDYSDSVMKSFDFVIASVHSAYTQDEKTMTKRIIKALKNPYVTMLGHSTGRLLLAREPYHLNLKDIIQAAADYGKMIEINANAHRFDLDWRYLRFAKEKGMKVSINPDAHSAQGMFDTFYGVGIARKGGLTKKDVFNTLPVKEVEKALKKK